MRIGLTLERFDPHRGGLENWTYQFAQTLAERGHEVHVLAQRFAHDALEHVIPHPLVGARSRLSLAQAAERTAQSLELDVVHDMGAGWCGDVFQPHGGSWASVCHRKLRAWPTCLRPLKQAFDQFSPRQREHRALMKQQFADRGQIMVALSHFVARDFQHFHGIRPEQIRIIYNGVDPERFSPQPDAELRQPLRRQLGVAPDEVLALTVAHNFPLKGVPSLLRAMSRLVADRRPIRLAVVGGKRLGRWRRTAARLGLGDRVRFVGSVESSAPYYAAADFCVHPTWYDPCSLVLLEAAASGLPVVTTRECNGVAELFQDGVDALLVSHPGEVDELAQKMNVLLDEAVRKRMAAATRRFALEHTFQRNVDEFLALYREIVARREAEGPRSLPFPSHRPRRAAA